MDGERMPQVDFTNIDQKNKRFQTILSYAKYIEDKNRVRAIKGKKMLWGARAIGMTCGLIAVSIYSFTIYRVKQETFLDDWDEPEIPR